MSNDTGAFGLKPIRMLDGSPWNGAVVKCYISAAYGTALYIGTPVIKSPTLAEYHASGSYTSVNIVAAVDGGVYWGVIVGFEANPDNLSTTYSPALTEGWAYVATGNRVVFAGRGDGAGTPTTAFVNNNAAMVATAAGSTATGLSGWHIGESTFTTVVTLPLQVIGKQNVENNELGDNAIWEVVLNTSELLAGDVLGIVPA